jgi:hypothetical protein
LLAQPIPPQLESAIAVPVAVAVGPAPENRGGIEGIATHALAPPGRSHIPLPLRI